MHQLQLFTNIQSLVNVRTHNQLLRGAALATLPCIDNAYLLVEDGIIKAFGAMATLQEDMPNLPNNIVDVDGQFILPCWCDSHTHIVFAGSRENEFVDKINGLSYAEIAAKGGGILNSAQKLANTREEELFEAALERIHELSALGTGAIEIKSGYGLTVEAEIKMLRVIKRLQQHTDVIIKATFLGAHTYPLSYKENHQGYVDSIIHEMLPIIKEENLADYIDVFCETGFFSPEETQQICTAALAIGLKPKLHVNQLNSIGGIEVGIANNALSLDHLETLTDHDIALLGQYKGCSTLLPTAAFFLRMPYQPARALINAGAAVTLASDFNPGSSPSGNMNFVTALSCIQMKMLPAEVINAATINGAYAMECESITGSIMIGKRADLIFTKKIPSIDYLFYSFSSNNIDKVMIKGNWVQQPH
ncbi:imidazolonepropionase [Ferruginibacter yonginensis]|uniref:Imidazolonepropionase n=1 Tax=Ferruginibacter yonginensis TaxID=1310416 RepID=A0ABV8QQ27_9BACT